MSCERLHEAFKEATKVGGQHDYGEAVGLIIIQLIRVMCSEDVIHSPGLLCGVSSQAAVRPEGDAGFELLDIFLSKVILEPLLWL